MVDPLLVGLSVIFQYTLEDFAALATELRAAGLTAHTTAGGHFPSLRPEQVLRLGPDIDSVTRFEGEYTCRELLRCLRDGGNWKSVDGLAYRNGDGVVWNRPRPLIEDLDALPPPARTEPRWLPRNVKVASMLATRGCLYDCPFCSIRQFYGEAPGPLRRVRAPGKVVAEMAALHNRDGIRCFLRSLDQAGLTGRICWKVSCRVDDVDRELMAQCRKHGLMAVYLGVESGSPSGLRTLHKHVTVEQNIEATEILKELGIPFEVGFMLFDPESTAESIRENIQFLRRVTGDGYCTANLRKMLPYTGTPIEETLRAEGRLKGTATKPDYEFRDPAIDWLAFYVSMAFRFRNFDRLGLVERLRSARIDLALAKAFEEAPWATDYEAALGDLTARSNQIALNTVEAALEFMESRDPGQIALDWPALWFLSQRTSNAEIEIQQELDRVLARYSPQLLESFAAEFSSRFGAGGQERALAAGAAV